MDGKPTDRVYLLPLEIKLKHSTIHLDDPCPFLAPNPGVATIHEYAAWASEASEDAEEEEEGEGLVKKGKEQWEDSGMAPAARIFPSRELTPRPRALCQGVRTRGSPLCSFPPVTLPSPVEQPSPIFLAPLNDWRVGGGGDDFVHTPNTCANGALQDLVPNGPVPDWGLWNTRKMALMEIQELCCPGEQLAGGT